MSGNLEMANDKMIVDIPVANEQNFNYHQEDIEMNVDISTNDANENCSSGHDSHSNEGEQDDKDAAIVMDSLKCYKSSKLSSKSKTQKKLIKTLQDLKGHLPDDRKIKRKSSVLAVLKYALRSIKQVKANEEYYQLMMINERYSCDLDILSYTVEDVKNITSEYIIKNADMFAVAVSLATGKILHISDQASCILHCKKDLFKNAKFVEFLAPQDVSVFYSSTTPLRLPSWSISSGVESATQECIKEKSFFCRFSAGKVNTNENHYHPFRMTPYLIKMKDAEDQLCCVLLAEKVHSGYEVPRIPPNKRVFTTTHTPSCLFHEVDERAVPLLGYLPQDLIGTSVLMHLHPSDRPLMLAIHKKILQCSGQPFDYSPIRFCTRNGEYITLDTSWSSFINPWSRKISFIIGRHKVRTAADLSNLVKSYFRMKKSFLESPLNEDVFAPECTEEKILNPNVQEITKQIYRLLLQPVHNSCSSGYGSLGSNGSHEHLMNVISSSDSNGNNNEDTQKIHKVNSFQDICTDGHVTRNNQEQAYFGSRSKIENQEKSYGEKPTDYHDYTKDITQTFENGGIGIACQRNPIAEELTWQEQSIYSYQQISCLDSVIRYLEGCCAADTVKKTSTSTLDSVPMNTDIGRKQMTDGTIREYTERGQSNTHIGPAVLDKSNASAIVGARFTSLTLPGKPESVASFTSQCSYSSTTVHVGDKKIQPELEIVEDNLPGIEFVENQTTIQQSNNSPKHQEKELFKKLGLTKEILAAHTQKEEQSFLNKCKEIKRSHIFQNYCSCYFQERPKECPGENDTCGLKHGSRINFSRKKMKKKNKKSESKQCKPRELAGSTTSDALHKFSLLGPKSRTCPPPETVKANYPIQSFPTVMPTFPNFHVFQTTGIIPSSPEDSLFCLNEAQDSGRHCPFPLSEFASPLVTPVVALVLPNYACLQINDIPQSVHPDPPGFSALHSFSSEALLTTPSAVVGSNLFPPESVFSTQPFHYHPPAGSEKNPVIACQNELSHSCSPQSLGPRNPSSSPLFQSQCSSPLQLNFLQLAEMPKVTEKSIADTVGNHGTSTVGEIINRPLSADNSKKIISCPVDSPMEVQNSDVFSQSVNLLDILLQGDASLVSGAVSEATKSLGFDLNGHYMLGYSGKSHTSKYFESVESAENNNTEGSHMEENMQFIKCVCQDPVWLLMANVDNTIMMTYQIPSRNLETVLKDDKLKLKQMQTHQPTFTEDQKRELLEVHPWIQKGQLPQAFINSDCICCEEKVISRSQNEKVIHKVDEVDEVSRENSLLVLNQFSSVSS